MVKEIVVDGARVNNLKNVSVHIPQGKLVVMTGVSGSGKSSLAFDTLYAEGQRRYVESLSSYARQFLGRMSKPDVNSIKGLPPAIAIEQKVIARNPRSTVGTRTEIYEYMRALFARIGHTISPISGVEVKKHTVDDVCQCAATYGQGTRFVLVSPLQIKAGETSVQVLQRYQRQGYARLWCKGEMSRIDDFLTSNDIPNVERLADYGLLIDRMAVGQGHDYLSRLADSVETAFYEGAGTCMLVVLPACIVHTFSTRFEADGMTFEEPSDQMFAFNSPLGACPTCEGFGNTIGIDEHLVIPDTSKSVYEGCVQCWHGDALDQWRQEFCRRAAAVDFPIFEPYYKLPSTKRDMLWHGLPTDKNKDIHEQVCIDAFFQMVRENQYKIQYRVLMSRYRGKTICPDCHGLRLRREATYVKINGRNITELVDMQVKDLRQWFDHIQLNEHEEKIAHRPLIEIKQRLQFLVDVGLDYLTLNRQSNTLSGGESQRISLATSLGSSLVGSLYILDEPSIGLHSRDTNRLISVLQQLRRLGNTVVVVEHDEEIMRAADYIIDIGPDAGRLGGEVVYEGEAPTTENEKQLCADFPKSHTLRYLTGLDTIKVPSSRRAWNSAITLRGARMNNLKGIDVCFPLNVLTCVTGVSGSGKSTLVKGILYPALKRHMGEVADRPGDFSALEGEWRQLARVEMVDQNPIGKSSRSNPATYVKAYDAIRTLFAEQPLCKQMGFTPQHFSFNADGGRCEQCKGTGVINVEMQFMADLEIECDACHGQRFKQEVLDVRFHGKNIYDVLEMTVSEAIDFFNGHEQAYIAKRLIPLESVGLGYIKLGQSSSTLSGGENQRVKLAGFIGQERHEPTLFIFDEPTTGLHFHDIQCLLSSLGQLIERGHSVLVIEHNLEVVKCADYVIDLGPEGGDAGGRLVCAGTPEEVAACDASITGQWLKSKL